MQKEVIDIEVKTGKSEANIQDVVDAIGNLNKTIVSGNQKTEESLKDVEKQSKKTRNILGGISKLFKGALGIGIVVQAFQLLKDTFLSNQKVADVFSNVMETVSIVFNQVVDAVVKGNGEFNALGKVLSGLVTIGLTPLKLSFNAIKLGLQEAQLFWEDSFFGGKDADKIKQLRADIILTKQDIYEVGENAVNAGKDIVNNFSDAVEGISNISIKAAYEQAQVNTQLEKTAKLATVANQGLIEQYDREAELLRQIRDDSSRSISERIKANEDLGAVLDKQQQAMQANADAVVAAAQAQFNKNKNDENAVALQEALNEQAAIDAQITGFRSEQQTNLNSLLQEQKDLRNELQLIGKTEVEAAKIEAEQKLETQIELINREVENEQERNALLLEAKRVFDEEIAALDADAKAKEKEINEKSLRDNEAINEAKRQSQLALVNSYGVAIGALGNLFEEGTAASKAAALSEIAINTGVGFANGLTIAQKSAAATGPGAAFAFPIFYATQIASVLGAVGKAKNILSTVKGGGSRGSASAPSVATPRMAATPSFNLVGQSGTNQLAESIGSQTKEPVKAFVVASDVSTAQSMERNIISGAAI